VNSPATAQSRRSASVGRQLFDDPAMRIESLADFENQAARNQRDGYAQVDVEDVVTTFARHLEHVAEAARDHHSGLWSASFDEGIRGQRCAVHNLAYVARKHAGLCQQSAGSVQYARRQIIIRREHLANELAAAADFRQNQVSEGAADVDAKREF